MQEVEQKGPPHLKTSISEEVSVSDAHILHRLIVPFLFAT